MNSEFACLIFPSQLSHPNVTGGVTEEEETDKAPDQVTLTSVTMVSPVSVQAVHLGVPPTNSSQESI